MLYYRERNKTATLIPEFAVEDLYLGRTAALVPDDDDMLIFLEIY